MTNWNAPFICWSKRKWFGVSAAFRTLFSSAKTVNVLYYPDKSVQFVPAPPPRPRDLSPVYGVMNYNDLSHHPVLDWLIDWERNRVIVILDLIEAVSQGSPPLDRKDCVLDLNREKTRHNLPECDLCVISAQNKCRRKSFFWQGSPVRVPKETPNCAVYTAGTTSLKCKRQRWWSCQRMLRK